MEIINSVVRISYLFLRGGGGGGGGAEVQLSQYMGMLRSMWVCGYMYASPIFWDNFQCSSVFITILIFLTFNIACSVSVSGETPPIPPAG